MPQDVTQLPQDVTQYKFLCPEAGAPAGGIHFGTPPHLLEIHVFVSGRSPPQTPPKFWGLRPPDPPMAASPRWGGLRPPPKPPLKFMRGLRPLKLPLAFIRVPWYLARYRASPFRANVAQVLRRATKSSLPEFSRASRGIPRKRCQEPLLRPHVHTCRGLG